MSNDNEVTFADYSRCYLLAQAHIDNAYRLVLSKDYRSAQQAALAAAKAILDFNDQIKPYVKGDGK